MRCIQYLSLFKSCIRRHTQNKRHPYAWGYTAFSKLRLEDLYGEENLLPPNVYMNLSDEDYNGMISLYTRDLGMILNYDETWINTKEFFIDPEELLVTLFVPDTAADTGDVQIKLGEYLRQSGSYEMGRRSGKDEGEMCKTNKKFRRFFS